MSACCWSSRRNASGLEVAAETWHARRRRRLAGLRLQRRIVDDVVKHRDFWWIVSLAAVYAGTVLTQGSIKLVLNIFRCSVGERATRAICGAGSASTGPSEIATAVWCLTSSLLGRFRAYSPGVGGQSIDGARLRPKERTGTMLGLILVIILVIFLVGGFSGRFGGYGYGYGHSGMGIGGVILIILVVLLLTGRI
jgi:hypothetical protein